MIGAVGNCVRGCGKRQRGGIYMETGLAPAGQGKPLEYFIICPPHKVNMVKLGLTPISPLVFQKEGVWHVMDFVGEKYYPNVADMLEEIRHFGLSRRMGKDMNFKKLTAQSRILLVHRKAYMDHNDPYWRDYRVIPGLPHQPCPKEMQMHDALPEASKKTKYVQVMCAGLYWQDLELKDTECEAENERDVVRKVGDTTYNGALQPESIGPEYYPAMFASFPISRLVVVEDPVENLHEDGLEVARKSSLPVDLVGE